MSNSSIEGPQKLGTGSDIYRENYVCLAAIAVYCYDYCLTFDREIKYFWKTPITLPASLFFSFKYSMLLCTIPELLLLSQGTWLTEESCSGITRLGSSLGLIALVSTIIFVSLRVYAMFLRSRLVLSIASLSGFASAAVIIYTVTRSSTIFSPLQDFPTCTSGIIGSVRSYENWTIAARVGAMINQGIVLVLTCAKTIQSKQDIRIVPVGQSITLREILLRDTALSFGFLCALNVTAIITGHLPQFRRIWNIWTLILDSMLMSRLALNMHDINTAQTDPDDAEELLSGTMLFVTVHIAEDVDVELRKMLKGLAPETTREM